MREWAMRCNGGSDFGIGLRLPCTKQGDEKPLFDCPSVDRKTDDEISAQQDEIKKVMDRLIGAIPKLNAMKKKMITHGLARGKATCPWCEEKNALKVSVALGVNNHMRAQCKACGEGFW